MTEEDRKQRRRERSREAQRKLRLDPAFLEKKKAWAQANIEKVREQRRRWRKANPEKIREYKKRDYEKHKDAIIQRYRSYYERNKETIKKNERERYTPEERSIKRNKFFAENPGKAKEYRLRHRAANRKSLIWSSVKKAARNGAIPFSLDREWIQERLDRGICEMSGIQFDFEHHIGWRSPNSPSIDRIDPKGPYSKENCRMIIWWLNRAMSNLGEEYCLDVMRSVFIKRGEMFEREPMQDAA